MTNQPPPHTHQCDLKKPAICREESDTPHSATRWPPGRVGPVVALVLALTATLLTGAPHAGAVAGYGDVAEGTWYTRAVQWSKDNAIADVAGTCFAPDAAVSRGEAAVWIHNMEDRPAVGRQHQFTDVSDASQNDAISWMSDTGITTGTSDTTFSPDDTLTRAQAAAFLYRLTGEPTAPQHSFNDVAAGWQQGPVAWMSDTGITTGTSDTTFSPDDTLTRAHLITFLYRYQGRPAATVSASTPACDPDAADTTPSDAEALVALFHATDGPNWTNNENWLDAVPLGEWHGVTTDTSGRVTGLSLNRNGLTGEVPSQLGNLTNLETLSLNFNEFTGPIPPELGNLTNLETLSLNFNEFTGPIPPELGNLTNLERLNLNGNEFTGPIPPELGNLTNLERLNLNGNELTGPIPPELGNLTNLANLGLSANQFTGPIPPEIGNLTNLTFLLLGNNRLTGPIPPEIGNLTNLERLRLWSNSIDGEIPPELAELANLVQIRLADNHLSGPIPPELAELTNLTFLDIGENGLTGPIPPEIAELAGLSVLRFDRNRLTGEIPPQLSTLADLTELNLGNNELTGPIPPEIGSLANLEHLYLGDNELTGPIPPELGNLTKLRFMWILGNKFTGGIPPQLGNLASLTSLRLGANPLGGQIPPELGNLTKLEHLSLFTNQLTGPIPPELGNLANLTVLRIGDNKLTGPIPPELADLAKATWIDLSKNQLSGEVPPRLLERAVSGDLWFSSDLVDRGIPDGPVPVRPEPPADAPPSLGPQPSVVLVEAFGGRSFTRPTEIGAYPVGPGDGPGLFMAEQDGRVLLLSHDDSEAVEILDLRDRVRRSQSHDGLLSVALDPRFEETGHLWIYYTASGGDGLVARVSRFETDLDDLRRVDPDSELVIMEIDHISQGHRGGAVRFGGDAMLYIGVGDGSFGGDTGRHGQNLATLLSSVLRIDVSEASQTSPYTVPPDNPFVDRAGARPEIWAHGFRNPWRMAFDEATGALWLGDVGQDDIEEVNLIEAGGNYGWSRLEGTSCFNPPIGCDSAGTVKPVVQYGHNIGCAVTGGVVYRGKAIPALVGHYLFADVCEKQLWALPLDGGDVIEIAAIQKRFRA